MPKANEPGTPEFCCGRNKDDFFRAGGNEMSEGFDLSFDADDELLVSPEVRLFDKIQTVAPGAIVENKRLGAALAFVRELQASYPPNRRRGDPRDVGRRILARDRFAPDSPPRRVGGLAGSRRRAWGSRKRGR